MIILEGPDGGGKTTLARTLSAELDLVIAPRVVSKDTNAMVDLKSWTEDNVQQGWQNTIFDRHRLISEPIYGSVLRSHFEPGFNDPQWLYFMNYQLYNHCRPLIIYCLPPYEVVREHVKADEDNKAVRDGIRKIYSLYAAKAASDCAIYGALLYSFSTSTDQVYEMVIHAARAAVTRGVGVV